MVKGLTKQNAWLLVEYSNGNGVPDEGQSHVCAVQNCIPHIDLQRKHKCMGDFADKIAESYINSTSTRSNVFMWASDSNRVI